MATIQPAPAALQHLIAPETFRRLAGDNGRLSSEEIRRGRLPLPPPPKGYQYTYQSRESPNAPLTLKKDSGLGKTLGKIGLIAGGVAATALTGGAASPLLAGAIGAGTGAGVGAIDGGWKGAGIGALTGGATGGLLSGAGGAAGSAVKQGAGQAVKSAFVNPQTWASIGGQVVPGKAGTALSLLGGASGGNMAGSSGWRDVLKSLATDPNTYVSLGSVLSGASGGAADERGRQNQFAGQQSATGANLHSTQQNALLALLRMAEQGTLDRAQLGLTAPTSRAKQVTRGSLMANLQPVSISHPRARMPTVTGGLTPAALSSLVREAGNELQTQGLESIRTKSDIPAMTDFESKLLPAPELTDYQEPGKMESIMGTSGLIGSLLGALARQGSAPLSSRSTPPLARLPSTPPSGLGG